jgi:hypothetical protein
MAVTLARYKSLTVLPLRSRQCWRTVLPLRSRQCWRFVLRPCCACQCRAAFTLTSSGTYQVQAGYAVALPCGVGLIHVHPSAPNLSHSSWTGEFCSLARKGLLTMQCNL